MKINLPPPPQRKSGRSKKSGWIVFVVIALILGLGGGIYLGQQLSGNSVVSGNTADQETTIAPVRSSENIQKLLSDADTAVADGLWVEARDLFNEVLNRDPKNERAKISLPFVDRHLEGARGGLNVTTSPEGATIKVGDRLTGKTPIKFDDIPLGKYKIVIQLEGYEAITQSVVISENKVTQLADVSLVRSSGSLNVSSEPKGAEFRLLKTSKTGEPLKGFIQMGTTPAKLDELEAGDYRVLVQSPGFPEYTEQIKVEHNRSSSVSAVFANKALSVTSDPSAAEVWLRLEGENDFSKRGETPIALQELPIGLHQLEVKYKNWVPIRRTVKLLPDVTPSPIDIEWKRSMVTLVSEPSGAEIYHYNRRLGNGREVTPFTVELPEGEYDLTAIHKELDPTEATVMVTGNEEGSLRKEFKFEYGAVSISSEPGGAAVFSNGKRIGVTPLKRPYVKPGLYTFTLSKNGYTSGRVSGQVGLNDEFVFSTRLKYNPAPKESRDFTNSYGHNFVWIAELGGWVGTHEVTQATYRSVMSENPSKFKGDNHPVDSVSWYAAAEFCKKLTINEVSRDAIPRGYVYKLPTDEQWSIFAARSPLSQAVTSADSRRQSTEPVGRLQPNHYGLYDVRGNVWEWCSDWYSPQVTKRARDAGTSVTEKWVGTDRKVLRGGSWNRSSDADLNLNYRLPVRQGSGDRYDIGFRVVLMSER